MGNRGGVIGRDEVESVVDELESGFEGFLHVTKGLEGLDVQVAVVGWEL